MLRMTLNDVMMMMAPLSGCGAHACPWSSPVHRLAADAYTTYYADKEHVWP